VAHTRIPIVRTDRLLLRGWRDDDRAAYAAINADPEVTEFLSKRFTRAESDAMVDQMLAGWERRGYGLWAVERRTDGVLLGMTGLSRHDLPEPIGSVVEVGWRFARQAWGHGYATEAARAALGFGFERLGLAEIVSFTVPDNGRSRRVMERLGMTRDRADDFGHPLFPEGHRLRAHVMYRLSRERWAGAKVDQPKEDQHLATWKDFLAAAPEMAEKGRALFYRTGDGEALLATVREGEPPRIHPIAVGIVGGGLYGFVLPSPKQRNLETDGRYALHAYPDAAVPHEFTVRGRVRRVDEATRTALAPGWTWSVGDAPAYEFLIDEAILGERDSRDDWPPRYTTWRSDRSS
jgi:RimJ/RimL family protein N-acetyltransferase